MNKNDLFMKLDDMDIDRIAQDFPVLSDDEKERIFAMSERKYNIENNLNAATDNDIDEEAVSGVERYKRPAWYKYASAAAALVLMIGGLSGSFMIISRNSRMNHSNEVPTTSATGEPATNNTTTAATGTTTDTTTEPTTVPSEESKDAIALDLTDRFADVCGKFYYHVAYDPNDVLSFDIYGTMTDFARVTEPGFTSPEDFMNALKDICTADLYNDLIENGGTGYSTDDFNYRLDFFPSTFFDHNDYSQYENGDTVDILNEFDGNTSVYIEYRGGLYVCTRNVKDDYQTYSDQPAITENGDETFSAVRCGLYRAVCNATDSKTGNPLTFSFEKEDGKWKISGITEDGNIDLNAEHSVEYYFKNVDTKYKNMDLNVDYIPYEDVDIISHNYNYGFTVHYIVKDNANGEPVLDFTADVTPVPGAYDINTGKPDYHSSVSYNYENVEIKEIN